MYRTILTVVVKTFPYKEDSLFDIKSPYFLSCRIIYAEKLRIVGLATEPGLIKR